jgi:hypothetical protein
MTGKKRGGSGDNHDHAALGLCTCGDFRWPGVGLVAIEKD